MVLLRSDILTFYLQAARRKEVQKLNVSRGSIEADRLTRLRKLIELVPEYRALQSHERKRIGLTLKGIGLSTREYSGTVLTQVKKKKQKVQNLNIEDTPLTYGEATLSDVDPVASADFDTTVDYLVIPDLSDDDLREILLSRIGRTFISTSDTGVPLWAGDSLHDDPSGYDIHSEPQDSHVSPEDIDSAAGELDIPVPETPRPIEPESSSQSKHHDDLERTTLQPDNQATMTHDASDTQHLPPTDNISHPPPSETCGSITPQPILSSEEGLTSSQYSDASVAEPSTSPYPPIETQHGQRLKPQDALHDASSQPDHQSSKTRDAADAKHIPPPSGETPPSTQHPDASVPELPITELPTDLQSTPLDDLDDTILQTSNTTFETDNAFDVQHIPASVISPSESSKQDALSALASLYREYCDSIPKVTSLVSSDSKPDKQTTTLQDPSEPEAEYAMSRHQLQLTVEEGKIWDELVESKMAPFNETMDVSLASLEEKSHLMSQSYDKRTNPPTAQTYEESKEIIRALGIPCMEVAGAFEAEALAASLVLNGHADYVVSEDTVCHVLYHIYVLSF